MSVKWGKIILFGDSLTERSFSPVKTSWHDGACWGALLANKFQRLCDVIPRGFSGYTSRSCRTILPYIFNAEMLLDVQAFVIFVGTNDVSGKEDMPEYHVPVKEYRENITEMIHFLKDNGLSEDKMILITPGPFHEELYIEICKKYERAIIKRDNEEVAQYANALAEIGKKFGIDVVNLYAEMMKDEDWSKYLSDGLHYSEEGSKFLYEKLLVCLEKKIDTSGRLMPYWREINRVLPKDATPELVLTKYVSPYNN